MQTHSRRYHALIEKHFKSVLRPPRENDRYELQEFAIDCQGGNRFAMAYGAYYSWKRRMGCSRFVVYRVHAGEEMRVHQVQDLFGPWHIGVIDAAGRLVTHCSDESGTIWKLFIPGQAARRGRIFGREDFAVLDSAGIRVRTDFLTVVETLVERGGRILLELRDCALRQDLPRSRLPAIAIATVPGSMTNRERRQYLDHLGQINQLALDRLSSNPADEIASYLALYAAEARVLLEAPWFVRAKRHCPLPRVNAMLGRRGGSSFRPAESRAALSARLVNAIRQSRHHTASGERFARHLGVIGAMFGVLYAVRTAQSAIREAGLLIERRQLDVAIGRIMIAFECLVAVVRAFGWKNQCPRVILKTKLDDCFKASTLERYCRGLKEGETLEGMIDDVCVKSRSLLRLACEDREAMKATQTCKRCKEVLRRIRRVFGGVEHQ